MPYRWNPRAARYVSPNGRFVSRIEVRSGLDAAIRKSGREVVGLSQQLRSGSISLQGWQLGMEREIKSAHLASAALGKGGFAQMAPADYGRVGARLKEQYGFLNRFASQIESGQQGLNGQLPIRSEMYIQAARATYHTTERREMEQRGVEEERSILGAADHCPDCLEEADKDWQPIGTLIPIGDRVCLTRCACVFDYRGAGVE